MYPLLLSMIAAIAYGLSDYLGGFASRRVPAFLVIAITYPLSILGVAALMPLFPGEFSQGGFLVGFGAGLLTGIAVWSFYEALARGPMSVVSPVAAVITAGLPAIIGIVGGERPSIPAVIGIIGAVIATVLVSLERPEHGAVRRLTPLILLLTVISGVCFALYLVLVVNVPEGEGMAPLLASRMGATVAIFTGLAAIIVSRRSRGGAIFGARRISRRTALTRLLPLAVGVAALDVIANTTYYLAGRQGLLSLVAVVTSLYPAVTVLAALTHGGERLRGVQVVGLGAAAAAVVLITLG